jgi:hypothetical protein
MRTESASYLIVCVFLSSSSTQMVSKNDGLLIDGRTKNMIIIKEFWDQVLEHLLVVKPKSNMNLSCCRFWHDHKIYIYLVICCWWQCMWQVQLVGYCTVIPICF